MPVGRGLFAASLSLLGAAASSDGTVCAYECAASGSGCLTSCAALGNELSWGPFPPVGTCASSGAGLGRRCSIVTADCSVCSFHGRGLLEATTAETGGAKGSEAGGAAAAGQAGHAGTRTWRWVDALADDGGLRPSAATDGEFSGTAFVYILTATWDASRNEHAHAVCSRLSPATGSVCHVVEGVNGRLLTPEQKANFVRLGYVSLAPLPERPWYSVQLPGPLRPLGREYPMNLLQYPGGLGNTLGNIFILKMMERVSRSAASDAVYLYLEDDADAGDPLELVERVKAMRADLPEGGWDLISLAPPQDVCERSRLLPSFPRSGLIRPRFSFSRTAGVVYSKSGIAALLANLPADNTIDMWYRRLMRQRKLRIYLNCGHLVGLTEDAKLRVVNDPS